MAHPRIEALTRGAITDTARDQSFQPQEIRKWSVVIEKRRFPVKQIIREAANRLRSDAPVVTPADLTAHDAVRYLKRLGFKDALVYEE